METLLELNEEQRKALKRALEREAANPQRERIAKNPKMARDFGITMPIDEQQKRDEEKNPSKK